MFAGNYLTCCDDQKDKKTNGNGTPSTLNHNNQNVRLLPAKIRFHHDILIYGQSIYIYRDNSGMYHNLNVPAHVV